MNQSTENSSQRLNEFAVMDLGSNSFHMIVAREKNGTLQIMNKMKQYVHLATGLNEQKELDQESITRGINCLTLFAERVKNFPPENIRIVGTYTLRVARNRHQFLQQAAAVLPYPIEIISGQEEARLIYAGIAHTESLAGLKLVIDIGGGSTEIAVGDKFEPLLVDSRSMGCVTYSQQFFPDGHITKSAFNRAKMAAEQQVEKINAFIQEMNIPVACGSSGTIKSIYNVLLDMGVSDGILTPQRINDLTSYVLEFKTFSDIDFPSLSKERKSIFVAGLAILAGLFSALNLRELHYTQSALREGVLYEMATLSGDYGIKQRTATALSQQYNVDVKHAHKVVNTTKYLLQQWKKQTPVLITPMLETTLYWAALLHEVGLNINLSSIHKHSAYILQNSNLPGFNQEQQLLLATLVRYHRKSIKIDNVPAFNLFEHKQIIPLLQLLRIAVLLNNQRQRDLTLSSFILNVIDDGKRNHLELIIDKPFAEKNRLIILDLEEEQRSWQQVKDWQLTVNIE